MTKFHTRSGHKCLWDSVGKLQLDFLIDEGLKPHHKFLDVGCGTFRAGRYIIPYLQQGNYWGFDMKPAAIKYGKNRVLDDEMLKREPHLFVMELSPRKPMNLAQMLGSTFDYILAHAFLDHVGPRGVKATFRDIAPALDPDGHLYATSFVNHDPEYTGILKWEIEELNTTVTHIDKEPWHYTIDFIEKAANNAGLTLSGCPEYEHPRGLTMFHFVRATDE